MAFKMNSGTVIATAAANARSARPENGTAGIPMELTSEATPK